MSHYTTLNSDWANLPGVNPITLEQVPGLFRSKHNQTNLPLLIEELLALQLEEYAYVTLQLEISDNGYCHWVKPTFASDRSSGSDKLRITPVVDILDEIFQSH